MLNETSGRELIKDKAKQNCIDPRDKSKTFTDRSVENIHFSY